MTPATTLATATVEVGASVGRAWWKARGHIHARHVRMAVNYTRWVLRS